MDTVVWFIRLLLCSMMRMSWKCLFVNDWKRWTEVSSVMFVFDVMLDDENELKMFVWKWLKEVNRSVMSNVRFWCDVGWWEWVENDSIEDSLNSGQYIIRCIFLWRDEL